MLSHQLTLSQHRNLAADAGGWIWNHNSPRIKFLTFPCLIIPKWGKHPSGDVMISPKYHCHPLPSCSCIVGHQIRLQAPSLSTASFQHGCRPTRPMRLGCWLGWLLVSNVGWKWHTQISWQHLISSPNNYTIYIHKEYIKKFYCLVSWWRMAKFHNHVWKGIIQRPHGQFLQQLHSDSRSTTWNGGLTRGG